MSFKLPITKSTYTVGLTLVDLAYGFQIVDRTGQDIIVDNVLTVLIFNLLYVTRVALRLK